MQLTESENVIALSKKRDECELPMFPRFGQVLLSETKKSPSKGQFIDVLIDS
jgi:hypothetical protein